MNALGLTDPVNGEVEKLKTKDVEEQYAKRYLHAIFTSNLFVSHATILNIL